MKWCIASYIARRFVAPAALARVVCVLNGWGTPSVQELLSLAVLVGFIAGDEVGTRGTAHVIAWKDAR